MSVLKFLRQYVRPIPNTSSPTPPNAGDVASPPAERRAAVRTRAPQGTQVLIIDDSKTVVHALTRMLHQNGFDPLHAFDAETGIVLAKTHQPHLIFLDIVLPGMNGFNALRLLRREPSMQHTPIIMISGNDQAVEQFYAQRIGADDFMKKPFSRAEVFARIDKLLGPDLIPTRRVQVHEDALKEFVPALENQPTDVLETAGSAPPTSVLSPASDGLQSAFTPSEVRP